MKKIVVLIAMVWAAVAAQATVVESVMTCPGEDASTQMNISWAAYGSGTRVHYMTQEEAMSSYIDVNSPRGKVVKPECERLCFTYDSISSKRPNGDDCIEAPIFFKCGASLTGLKPDTEYTYYICDKQGQPMSEPHTFKTAPSQGEWSCCVISDFHVYAPLPARTRAAMSMLEQVEKFDPGIDWVLHLGDVCAWGGSWSFWRDLYKEPYFHKYMWAGLNGNHDNMSRKYARCTSDFFRDANYVPRNGYKGQEGVCYHFRYGDAMFVMLNNEEMRDSTGFDAAAQWLREVVTDARRGSNPPRYVIVCEHYQWFYATNGKTSQYGRWSKIFDELGVDLALSGNNHIYARTGYLYDGKETDGSRGTVYVQTPSTDDERGQGMDSVLTYNQDLIKYRFTEGDKTVGALNMKVNDQRIVITLLDRNGTILDTVEVKAK